MPEMRKVYSSHIDEVGYDAEAQEMHVRFQNGSHIVYQGVPPEAARGVMNAPSIGSALWGTVRGRFEHTYRHRVATGTSPRGPGGARGRRG